MVRDIPSSAMRCREAGENDGGSVYLGLQAARFSTPRRRCGT